MGMHMCKIHKPFILWKNSFPLDSSLWRWRYMHMCKIHKPLNDKFIWRWAPNQQYSASSTYRAFFTGQCGIPGAKELSKCRAPPCCKFSVDAGGPLFGPLWQAPEAQYAELRLLCLMLPSNGNNPTPHLNLRLRERNLVQDIVCKRSRHPGTRTIADWWISLRKQIPKGQRKGFDSLTLLTTWLLWKERNNRIFNNTFKLPAQLLVDAYSVQAGHTLLSDFLQWRTVSIVFSVFSLCFCDPSWVLSVKTAFLLMKHVLRHVLKTYA